MGNRIIAESNTLRCFKYHAESRTKRPEQTIIEIFEIIQVYTYVPFQMENIFFRPRVQCFFFFFFFFPNKIEMIPLRHRNIIISRVHTTYVGRIE
jgi:hypothetical protein